LESHSEYLVTEGKINEFRAVALDILLGVIREKLI
jgi:hypothetical protein